MHSYYLQAEKRKNDVAATTEYITHVHASVEHDNIFVSVSSEKSGDVGFADIKEFL